jgi:uncharacterized protein YrzB (UPF0473 family)
MDENMSDDIYSISDEDGKNYQVEHLDTIEMDGVFYLAFLPIDENGNENVDVGMVILKTEKGEDGNNYFVIPTDEEMERAYDRFMEKWYEEDEQ